MVCVASLCCSAQDVSCLPSFAVSSTLFFALRKIVSEENQGRFERYQGVRESLNFQRVFKGDSRVSCTFQKVSGSSEEFQERRFSGILGILKDYQEGSSESGDFGTFQGVS